MEFKVVDHYEKYGRKIVIVCAEPANVEESRYMKPWYCGYVSVKSNNYDWDYFEERYDAPGGDNICG